MNLFLVIIGMGIITYAIRLSLIVVSGRFELGPNVMRALRYVPPAVLSAIVGPEMLQPGGALDLSLGNARILSGVVAILIAWKTKNVIWTVLGGLIVLWAVQWLVG